jgi:hypothetical protein
MTDYILLADAKTWITANILDITNWSAASDAQKQIALNQAMDHIDNLQLDGVKVDTSQVREFPRCIYSPAGEPWWFYENMDYLFRGAGWYCQSAVPQQVIDATCYEAIEILNHFLDAGKKERLDLQRDFVQSVKYGDTSESYFKGAGRFSDLISKDAARLMKRFRPHPTTI